MEKMHYAEVFGFFLLFFLIGGVPFGLLIARLKKVELRKIGSGNIGATNVYRALGLRYAILVFVLDGMKGALPVLICEWYYGRGFLAGLAGLISVLGHIFSPYLKFRGGKGVATGFGALLVISPLASLISFAVWLFIVALTKIVGLGSIISAVLVPVWILFFKEDDWILYSAIGIVAVAIFSHHQNIRRLLKGEEKKIGKIKQG